MFIYLSMFIFVSMDAVRFQKHKQKLGRLENGKMIMNNIV
jgi:hypothetical protein